MITRPKFYWNSIVRNVNYTAFIRLEAILPVFWLLAIFLAESTLYVDLKAPFKYKKWMIADLLVVNFLPLNLTWDGTVMILEGTGV